MAPYYSIPIETTNQLGKTIEEVETKLENNLNTLSAYVEKNFLKPKFSKRQTYTFHLHSKWTLTVVWYGVTLEQQTSHFTLE